MRCADWHIYSVDVCARTCGGEGGAASSYHITDLTDLSVSSDGRGLPACLRWLRLMGTQFTMSELISVP